MPYSNPEAQREYQRQWMARRRLEFFSDKICAQCGGSHELQLDHIDPTQKVDHKIWSWSVVRREAELAKCQVLCRECHEAKSLEQFTTVFGREIYQHGTRSMYRWHACRCDLCKAWKKRDNAQRGPRGWYGNK